MFVIYLVRELRRRMRQAVFIALGLAVGIGLVITVTAASWGVKNAQATVLHSLYGVGTDTLILVTHDTPGRPPGAAAGADARRPPVDRAGLPDRVARRDGQWPHLSWL